MTPKTKPNKKYQPIDSDPLVEIKDIHVPTDDSGDMHNHISHEILILLDGKLNLYTEHSGIELAHGDAVLIPSYAFHGSRLLTSDRYDRIVINVTEDLLNHYSTKNYNLNICFMPYNDKFIHYVHLEDDDLSEITDLSYKLRSCTTSDAAENEVLRDAYTKLILVKLCSCYSQNDMRTYTDTLPQIAKLTFEYIDKHLTEEISLSILEKEIHNNGTYISRCIKKISGLSVSEYIIAKRIALACRLLKDGHTAYDACFSSGFNNYSNFSRTFTKKVGKSPKKYQSSIRSLANFDRR